MQTYIPLSWPSIPHPTPLGHHRAPSWAPCAVQQLPTSNLFYTWSWTYASATLSIRHTLSSHSVFTSPFSMSAPPFLPSKWVHQNHCFRVHVCVNIRYFFSDLIHSVWQALSSSTSLQPIQFHFFLWLTTPFCICTTSSLFIHLLMDIQVASMSWLL